jgi:hypothetical protein
MPESLARRHTGSRSASAAGTPEGAGQAVGVFGGGTDPSRSESCTEPEKCPTHGGRWAR